MQHSSWRYFYRCSRNRSKRLCFRLQLVYLGRLPWPLAPYGHLAVASEDSRVLYSYGRIFLLPHLGHHSHFHLLQCQAGPHPLPLRVLLYGTNDNSGNKRRVRIIVFTSFVLHKQICFLENTTLTILWWLKVSDMDPLPWFHIPALAGQLGCFVMSVVLLSCYYKCLHPNLLLPNVGICTKDTVCLSDTGPRPIINGVPSPRTSPTRLGRLDIQQEIQDI